MSFSHTLFSVFIIILVCWYLFYFSLTSFVLHYISVSLIFFSRFLFYGVSFNVLSSNFFFFFCPGWSYKWRWIWGLRQGREKKLLILLTRHVHVGFDSSKSTHVIMQLLRCWRRSLARCPMFLHTTRRSNLSIHIAVVYIPAASICIPPNHQQIKAFLMYYL